MMLTAWPVSEYINSPYLATRGLWATDLVSLNHDEGTRTTPKLAPSFLTSTTQTGERLSTDGFNVHQPSTWWAFSGTRLELIKRRPRVRCPDH
ncbi:hypothetical protein TNCV_3057251 [Trichonephila clavipes]|nr:hypothetical protein TNCV_3057251 [Trichonephila clavipes]